MAKTDSRILDSSLKKGELSSIYYLFGADVTGVERMTKKIIKDYNCEKPYEDMRGKSADDVTKKLLEILKDIPRQTVVIFNVTGFEIKVQRDYKSGQNIIKDKNKKLADFAAKNGILCEFPMKTSSELSKLIASKVSARGGLISIENGKELAEMR